MSGLSLKFCYEGNEELLQVFEEGSIKIRVMFQESFFDVVVGGGLDGQRLEVGDQEEDGCNSLVIDGRDGEEG